MKLPVIDEWNAWVECGQANVTWTMRITDKWYRLKFSEGMGDFEPNIDIEEI